MIRLVLVEDHEALRASVRLILSTEAMVIEAEAATGLAGLEAVQTQRPDVAILNIGLPDMDGIELTRQIKESCPETRVLILTSQDSEQTVLAAFGAGADSYCRKDVDSANLPEAIRQTYEGNAWVDPAIAKIVLTHLRQTSPNGPDTVAIAPNDPEYREMLSFSPLTERELEVLTKIVEGLSNAQIAEVLCISLGTTKTHVRNILTKLCADDRTQAAIRALRAGLVK